jgi:hypothetical protein
VTRQLVDTAEIERENPSVVGAGRSRRRLERTLRDAFAEGLISDETFAVRLDQILDGGILDVDHMVGDLQIRTGRHGVRDRVLSTMNTIIERFDELLGEVPTTLLALDWIGEDQQLILGRSSSCDLVIRDAGVSRRHARLMHRDGIWLLQDLASTNGTYLNGRRVGRCSVRPNDILSLGQVRLRID